MRRTMGRASELKYKLLEEVYDFLDKHKVKTLNAYDVDEGSSPIVQEDYSTEEDHYTLDRIYFENGELMVDASGCYGNDTFHLSDLDVEVVEGILDWLTENEETIDEIVAEQD